MHRFVHANHCKCVHLAILEKLIPGNADLLPNNLAASHLGESRNRCAAIRDAHSLIGQVGNEGGQDFLDRVLSSEPWMVDVLLNEWKEIFQPL